MSNFDHLEKGKGVVTAIYICREKGKPREYINEGMFKENYGLLDDAYSGKGDRQVTILGFECRKEIEESQTEGLCFKRFIETLRIKDINLYELSSGTRVKIRDTILEISKIGKRCFPECTLVKQGKTCSLSQKAIFIRVIKSGKISIGDLVEVLE